MRKHVLLAGAALAILAIGGLYFWAQSVLAQDGVRAALAAQLSSALGQPVSIDGISAGLYPRVTVRLTGVRIGDPAQADIQTLHVGTALGALLSRRIEHASLLVENATVQLPLSLSGLSAPDAERGDTGAPIQLVSIDEAVLRGVQIVSGGRTLRADVEIGPSDRGLEIRRMRVAADDLAFDATGTITDLAGPVGELSVNAGAVSFDDLLAFIADFQRGAGLDAVAAGQAPASGSGSRPGMDIAVTLDADRATLGDLVLDTLGGRARITPGEVILEPISFQVFGGAYDGTLALTLGDTPGYHLTGTLADVDVAAATAFAGSPGVVSGRLASRIDLRGAGFEAGRVAQTTRGTIRADIADGVVSNLGLVRAIVIATANRAESSASSGTGSTDEPFSRLGATLTVENGVARTDDLHFESDDLSVDAQGAIALDGDPITLTGRVRLSEQLTKEGGTDLARYTQEQGRVTLPVTITGSAGGLSVRVDVGEMMQRAIRNRAEEEAKRAIERNLRGILR